jgi:lincosamide nucleotidyltransferase A/C/D/E
MADAPQRAYRGRTPSAPMGSDEALRVLHLLERNGIEAVVDGGWGVDALLGEQTREHDDLDLVVDLHNAEAAIAILEGAGYELVAGEPPHSFVLVNEDGVQVDVHPVERDAEGNGAYLMESGTLWTYPAEGLRERGTIAGRSVRCLSARTQVIVHAGYELGPKDYKELRLLHERCGVELPETVRAQALAAEL